MEKKGGTTFWGIRFARSPKKAFPSKHETQASPGMSASHGGQERRKVTLKAPIYNNRRPSQTDWKGPKTMLQPGSKKEGFLFGRRGKGERSCLFIDRPAKQKEILKQLLSTSQRKLQNSGGPTEMSDGPVNTWSNRSRNERRMPSEVW